MQERKQSGPPVDAAQAAAVATFAALSLGGPVPTGFADATAHLSAGASGAEEQIRRALAVWRDGQTRRVPPVWIGAGPLPTGWRRRWLFWRIRVFDALARRRVRPVLERPLRAIAGGGPDVGWLMLLGPDGHGRQAALDSLQGALPTPFLAGVALRRLNDWAGPVRQAAEQRLPGLIAATPAATVGLAFAAILPQAWRSGHGWARAGAGLNRMLALPGVGDAITDHLLHARSGPAPSVLPILLRAGLADEALRALATAAVQPGLRAIAVQALVEGQATWAEGRERVWTDRSHGEFTTRPTLRRRPLRVPAATPQEMQAFAADSSPRVRRALLDGLDRTRPDALPQIAGPLLQDPFPSIAHRARVLMRQP